MASIHVPEAYAVLTVDGGADGFVTVADNSKFYPGATAWLYSTSASQECTITELSGTTKVGLRFKKAYPSYGRDSCTAYTTALTSKLSMESQVVSVDQPTFAKKASV